MDIREQIRIILRQAGALEPVELSIPPKPELGDFAYGCFALGKARKNSPMLAAQELAEKITEAHAPLVEKAVAAGPYVNIFVAGAPVADAVLRNDALTKPFVKTPRERVMVEFAHPNTHKAFHIGHLRNIITGESLVRLLEHAGYEVIRANYQGDVGLHIAKCLYGITQDQNYTETIEVLKNATPGEQAAYLGKSYAEGAAGYEGDPQIKKKIAEINAKIYNQDPEFYPLYEQTRQWSLNYFKQNIYQRLDTHFDRLYFESEVFGRGADIVRDHLEDKTFEESDGATIFRGSKFGLHDRVFLNSQQLPTYEAKELALGELQFKEYHPTAIYHVVANEQGEYFKVVFKAMEATLPESKGKEHHLVYGWVRLKEGKMSSRTGKVVLAEQLLNELKSGILEGMEESQVADKSAVAEAIGIAAAKYAFLRTSTANDIIFDLESSISMSGDSGPYLLYMCARIRSILKKVTTPTVAATPAAVQPQEKALLLQLDSFAAVAKSAAEAQDPSQMAHYLFALAQRFTAFYEACPVLKSEGAVQSFRLEIVKQVLAVAEKGLYLLGIKTVEEM